MKNRILLNSMRFGDCAKCGQVVIGCTMDAKHYCAADPDNPLSLTETDLPRLRRLLYAHNVLNHPQLFPLVTDMPKPSLISRRVASILTPARFQAALPLDYTHYDPTKCSTSVYLPATLKDDEYLWVTLAVDVILSEQERCPEECKPTTATQRNVAWIEGRADALRAWAKPRMTGTQGKPCSLYIGPFVLPERRRTALYCQM